MSMLVSAKSAKRCCRGCDVDYGKSSNSKAKKAFKRQIRTQSKRAWRKEL